MRRLILLCLLLPLLCLPVFAEDLEQEQAEQFGAQALEQGLDENTRELLKGQSATEGSDLAEGITAIFDDAAQQSGSTLRQAAALAAVVMGITLLCGTVAALQADGGLRPLSVVGALGITAACTMQFHAMVSLATETVQTLSDYSKLMLPALATATAASGAVGSAGAVYAGTVFFSELLTVMIAKILVPMVYLYIAVSTVHAALDNDLLSSIRDFLAWLLTGSLKLILSVYITYITLSGIITGASDALSVKATKLALGGMVPVVGSILANASETVVVSASLLKNSMGIFGMLAVLGFCAAPFFKIAVQYLVLKVTKAVCGTIGQKNHVELVDDLAKSMGILLGMTGACGLMLLLSAVCSMKVVMG